MSSATGQARAPRQLPRPHLQLPRLRAVAPVSRVPRLPFLLLTTAAIVAGVFGLVALNVSVNQQSFRISDSSARTAWPEPAGRPCRRTWTGSRRPRASPRRPGTPKLVPAGRPRVVAWPGSRARDVASPGAATSPRRPRGRPRPRRRPVRLDSRRPVPLKRYLAEPSAGPNQGRKQCLPTCAAGRGRRPAPAAAPAAPAPGQRPAGGLLALLILSMLAFLAISGLIILQVFDAGSLDQAAARQRLTVIDLPATRGRIFDRNLNDLAISIGPGRLGRPPPGHGQPARRPAWPGPSAC